MEIDKTVIDGFFDFYRKRRPENFSDSTVEYIVPLTVELFDHQLSTLSTQKKHSEFENFVLALAGRLITPNINGQTGPDGGGDGKIDGETYEVSDDISSKWYVAEESLNGRGDWAIAISCKSKWKEKLKSDVKKIADTNRGYTRVLFFTNQMVKGDKRVETENDLQKEFGLEVRIFDGNWCRRAVFERNCIDIALDKLNFSDTYKQKNVIVGPLDKERKERLEELEKSFSRRVEGLNTGYIDDLCEAYFLCRGLELDRKDIEGRIYRAMRECDSHGTPQQLFNITYDFAWTSFFWFRDVEQTYKLYLKLKDFVIAECNAARLEKLLNIFTNLNNASRIGLIDKETIKQEYKFIVSLDSDLEKRALPSSRLYLKLYIKIQKLISYILKKKPLDEIVAEISPLLSEAVNHVDISSDALFEIFTMLNDMADDSPDLDKLVNKFTREMGKREADITSASFYFERAQKYLERNNWSEALKLLGFCVQAYDNEEHKTEMIKSAGLIGHTLNKMDLPYSALTYYVKCVAMLLNKYYTDGQIQHMLLTVLRELCHLELRIGRLAMFLVWRELLLVVSQNQDFASEKQHWEDIYITDASWSCRLAIMNTTNPLLAILPDILKRQEMHFSADFLMYILGYPEKTAEQFREEFAKTGDIRTTLQNQKVFDDLLCDTILSASGRVELYTTVKNCKVTIVYDNCWNYQVAAEMFLAMTELAFATTNMKEAILISSDIKINIVETVDAVTFSNKDNSEYQLAINKTKFSEEELFVAFTHFMGCLYSTHSLMSKGMEIFEQKQAEENWIGRISYVKLYKVFLCNSLGDEGSVKYRIADWSRGSDYVYQLKDNAKESVAKEFSSRVQKDNNFYKINSDMTLWEGAGWKGCSFMQVGSFQYPMVFGLAFLNIERGRKIVSEWKNGKVKIFIIRGIDANNPAHYRVCVSPKISFDVSVENRYAKLIQRFHTMTPDSTINLDMFEASYKRFGGCWLQAFEMDEYFKMIEPKNTRDAFKFTDVVFKNAWEIGLKDESMVGIFSFDNPYIPAEHKEDAPVLKVLEIRKSRNFDFSDLEQF